MKRWNGVTVDGNWTSARLVLRGHTEAKLIGETMLQTSNPSIERAPIAIVSKGFTQKEGIYYFDTYAPVARTTTIRVLIALTSIYYFGIRQMDVKTTFLNGE